MNTLPLTFAVNGLSTAPWSFEQDLRAYRDMAVSQFELCEDKLDESRAEDQLAALSATGLRVCSVQPSQCATVAGASEPGQVALRERIERYRRSLERLAPHAPGAVFVTTTGPAPDCDLERGRREAVEFHRALLPVAEDLGVRLAVEPLDPVLLNPGTCLWTFGQAVDFVEAVGEPGLGICVDIWNLWQDPQLETGMLRHGNLIQLVQVGGWRAQGGRCSLGTGPVTTGRLLRTVHEAGYDGPCVLEIRSSDTPEELSQNDLAHLIMDNRDALGRAWHAAGSETSGTRSPVPAVRGEAAPSARCIA